jgi:hypothetical protein
MISKHGCRLPVVIQSVQQTDKLTKEKCILISRSEHDVKVLFSEEYSTNLDIMYIFVVDLACCNMQNLHIHFFLQKIIYQ